MEEIITFYGQPCKVVCDLKCEKAWGINGRPTIRIDPDNEDDYAFLSDGELGLAPANPGTYEGGQGKPTSSNQFPTKWCVRECERCAKSKPGEHMLPLKPKDFSERVYNMYYHYQ